MFVFAVDKYFNKSEYKWHNFVIYITIKILFAVFWNALNGVLNLQYYLFHTN